MHRNLMRFAFAAVAVLAVGSSWSANSRAEDKARTIPDLKVESYTLPNGLNVILHEDHTTPFVGVNLWYKVGSKDEKLGRTGFAHLFEHLMFQGSKNHNAEYFAPLEKLGAQINGSTSSDRTNYYEALPTNGLETALWLEADRMGFLLSALDQAKLDNQRDVVKNERRQRVDNVPYGMAGERLDEVLYPSDHPYHHSVIGSMADLSSASLDDVSTFFRTYYSPNNATLTLAGDINPAEARKLVEKYFGPIPKGPEVTKLTPKAAVLTEPVSIVMTDDVRLPRTQLVWPTVAQGDADEAALDTLASILGQLPNGNRLFLALQYDKQLATNASAFHNSSALAGTFTVSLTPQPGKTIKESLPNDDPEIDRIKKEAENRENLAVIVGIADAEIARLKKDGPTEEELTKVKNQVESRSVLALQTVQAKADFFNRNFVETGDPLGYKKQLRDAYAVTADDVKRVANKYLVANRVRLDVNPGPKTPRPEETPVDRSTQTPLAKVEAVPVKDSFDRSIEPKPGANPAFTPAPVVRRKLSNGLEVLIGERHNLPIVGLNLVVKGGGTLVPPGKEGLASLTGDLLTEGTATRTSLQLASELSELGASINGGGGPESCNLSLSTLTRNLPKALDIYTDVLLHPSFPEKELKRLKTQRLSALLRQADSPPAIAGLVFPKLLYGEDHPYGRPNNGTPKSIKGLTRDDIVGFYKTMFVPNNASLVVVGDITPDAIIPVLEAALKDWKPGSPVIQTPTDAPAPSQGLTVYLIDKPKAAQSILAVGQVGVARSNPDYFPLTIMNAVLGGQFTSRINMNLREDKGYTYGARSSFNFAKGPGPFEANAPVDIKFTKPALVELMKELTDISGPRPANLKEITDAKDRLIKGFPARFESIGGGGGRGGRGGGGGLGGTLAELVIYDLPNDYFTTYRDKVEAVTPADVERVAKKYLDAGKMTILIVGDRAVIESQIKELPFVKEINLLDNDGKPVASEAKK
jgi:zinc protease